MENIYDNIGNKIKELRLKYGNISQEELAQELKIQANTLSRWETAKYKPSIEDLHKIAKFFGERISIFFPTLDDTKLQALMSATENLDDEELDEVTRYAEFRKARRIMKQIKK